MLNYCKPSNFEFAQVVRCIFEPITNHSKGVELAWAESIEVVDPNDPDSHLNVKVNGDIIPVGDKLKGNFETKGAKFPKSGLVWNLDENVYGHKSDSVPDVGEPALKAKGKKGAASSSKSTEAAEPTLGQTYSCCGYPFLPSSSLLDLLV